MSFEPLRSVVMVIIILWGNNVFWTSTKCGNGKNIVIAINVIKSIT
jgi:hypothetical protein